MLLLVAPVISEILLTCFVALRETTLRYSLLPLKIPILIPTLPLNIGINIRALTTSSPPLISLQIHTYQIFLIARKQKGIPEDAFFISIKYEYYD